MVEALTPQTQWSQHKAEDPTRVEFESERRTTKFASIAAVASERATTIAVDFWKDQRVQVAIGVGLTVLAKSLSESSPTSAAGRGLKHVATWATEYSVTHMRPDPASPDDLNPAEIATIPASHEAEPESHGEKLGDRPVP